MKSDFFEQYKHPKWQKRRLEMCEAACWSCQDCGAETKTLNVHHKQYFKGRKIWEYTDEELVCLCEDCHKSAHHLLDIQKKLTCQLDLSEMIPLLVGYHMRNIEIDEEILQYVMDLNSPAFLTGYVASYLPFFPAQLKNILDLITAKGNEHVKHQVEMYKHLFNPRQ